MNRNPFLLGLPLILTFAPLASLSCGGSEPGGAGGSTSTGATTSSAGMDTSSSTGGACGAGKHDAGLGLCVDDSPLVLENLSATLKPAQFGDYDLQLVFAARNTSAHAMSKCNGGSLEGDQGYKTTVDISGSCGGGEVCPDDGSSDQICTLAPGGTTGIYTLGVYDLKSALPPVGSPITLTIKGFLDDATPVTAIAQALVVE